MWLDVLNKKGSEVISYKIYVMNNGVKLNNTLIDCIFSADTKGGIITAYYTMKWQDYIYGNKDIKKVIPDKLYILYNNLIFVFYIRQLCMYGQKTNNYATYYMKEVYDASKSKFIIKSKIVGLTEKGIPVEKIEQIISESTLIKNFRN